MGRHAPDAGSTFCAGADRKQVDATTSVESLRREADCGIVAGHRTPPQRQSSLRRKRAQNISRSDSIARCSKQSIKVHSREEIAARRGFTPRSRQLDNQAVASKCPICALGWPDRRGWNAHDVGSLPVSSAVRIRYATELTTSGPLYSVTHTGLEIGQDEFDDRHARPSVGS